jgi:hypothetical protein
MKMSFRRGSSRNPVFGHCLLRKLDPRQKHSGMTKSDIADNYSTRTRISAFQDFPGPSEMRQTGMSMELW